VFFHFKSFLLFILYFIPKPFLVDVTLDFFKPIQHEDKKRFPIPVLAEAIPAYMSFYLPSWRVNSITWTLNLYL